MKMAGRKREVTNEQILVEFYLHDDPALVAKEIGAVLGMSRQGVHERLEELEDMALIHSKKPGRDRIYWITDDGEAMAKEQLRD